jgi:iduronate 2-sulfatase
MKNLLKTSLILVIAILMLASCSIEVAEQARPNILFVSIDDLRPALGSYGDSVAVTPNIDRFAAESTVFLATYAQVAVCAPSRASLMTGLRPDSTRVWHLGDKFREINPATVTMPQYFSKHGYYTVNIGKIFHNYMPDSVSWDEPDLRPARFVKPDWLNRDGETFYISEEISAQQAIKRDSLLKLRPVRYADGWNTGPAWEAADVHDSMYYDGAQIELAKKTLLRLKDKKEPFFFGLGFFRPHLPFAVPKKYWDMYDPTHIPTAPNAEVPKNAPIYSMNSMYELRHYDGFNHIGHPTSPFTMNEDTARILKHGYYASVSYVDALLGDLIMYMKEIGIYDNTIIVLWGDHGWKLGDHNSWGKMTNYNIDLKVPLIVRSPYKSQVGNTTQAITELVDIFPTLCDLANIPKPAYAQGASLVPLMDDPNLPWKKASFSQFHRRPQETPDGNRYMGYSVNTQKYHYIAWHTWDNKSGTKGELVGEELYDTTNDPTERYNVANESEYQAVIKDMALVLTLGWREALPD